MATIETVKSAAMTTPSSDVIMPSRRPHGEERALARVSNHGEYAAILRDARKSALLRMRLSLKRLSILDRCRGLFGRSRRQRRWGAGLLRFRIGPRRLGRGLGWPRTGCRGLRRRGRFGVGARSRLQRLRRLRHLRIMSCEPDHRKAEYRKPRRHHRGCEQQILPESTFPVVRRHIFHRISLVCSTGGGTHCSLGNRARPSGRHFTGDPDGGPSPGVAV
jgi:hypothetical protein